MSSTTSAQARESRNQDQAPELVDAAAALSVDGHESTNLTTTAQHEAAEDQSSATIEEREQEILELAAEITLRGNELRQTKEELDEWQESLSKIQEGLAAHASRLFAREKAVVAREEAVKKREAKAKRTKKVVQSRDREYIIGDLLPVKTASGPEADRRFEQRKEALRQSKANEAAELETVTGKSDVGGQCTRTSADSIAVVLNDLTKLSRKELDDAWNEPLD